MKSDSELIRETAERTARIESRLFGASQGDEGFIASATARLNDHTKRLKSLEHWRWFLEGGGAVIMFEVSLLLTLVSIYKGH